MLYKTQIWLPFLYLTVCNFSVSGFAGSCLFHYCASQTGLTCTAINFNDQLMFCLS
jgi:hypothetical protein